MIGRRYRIVKKISTITYLVNDEHNNHRLLVIKQLGYISPTDLETKLQFLREVEILTHLSNPNIVTVYDWFVEEDTYYLIMEYVEGQTLTEYIENKNFSVNNLIDLSLTLAEAIDYLHSNSLVHGNLNQDSIIMMDNIPKIAGFCWPILENNSDSFKSPLPPERKAGLETDERSDVFSLGLIMKNLKLEKDIDRMITQSLNPIPELRPELKQIIRTLRTARKNSRLTGLTSKVFPITLEDLKPYRNWIMGICSGLLFFYISYRWLSILGYYNNLTIKTGALISGMIFAVQPVFGLSFFGILIWYPLWKLSKLAALMLIIIGLLFKKYLVKYPKQSALLISIPAVPDMGIFLPFWAAIAWGGRTGFIIGLCSCLLTELGQLVSFTPLLGFIKHIPVTVTAGIKGLTWWQIIKIMSNPLYWFWQPGLWGVSAFLAGKLSLLNHPNINGAIILGSISTITLIGGYSIIKFYLNVEHIAFVTLGAAAVFVGLTSGFGLYIKRYFI